jgi:hypothetical protein
MIHAAHHFVAPTGYVASVVRSNEAVRRGRSGYRHFVTLDLTNAGTTTGLSQNAGRIESSMHESLARSVAASTSTRHTIAAKDGAFDGGEDILVC